MKKILNVCLPKLSGLFYCAALFLILEDSVGFAQSNCVAPPSGLVAWWPAEGTANDIIGGINGVLVNGTSFTAGYVGQAFSFDGVSQYVTNSTPGLTNIQNTYTMEFWARPGQARASTPESTGNIDGTSNQRFAIFPNDGKFGPVGAGVSVGTNGVSVFELGSAYNPALLVYDTAITNWAHIAVVYSNQQPSLYLNGALVRVGLTSTRSSYPSTCLGEAGLGFGYYAGLLDEVSIYNRALSATEIAAIYNSGSAGKCPPPSPPFIVVQPTNETVAVGSTAVFSVTAGGGQPLSYQWNFNGAPIANATSSNLTLSNVQFSNAGPYSVLITNVLGSTNSTEALLTVISATPPCAPLPADIVGWWRAEGNANDSVGTNNGTANATVAYVAGEVGQAFQFNGSDSRVRITDSQDFILTNGLTIEGWINVAGDGGFIFYRADDRPGLDPYAITMGNPGFVNFFIQATNNDTARITAPVTYHQWQHIAGTWDRTIGKVRLYVNGLLMAETNTSVLPVGALDPNYDPAIGIGNHGGASFNIPFNGLIDEIALFSRALSQTEIQAIYNYGVTGKCFNVTGPYIYVQPTNQSVYVGQSATFAVAAGGTPPLSYQWNFNGTNILGATGESITLSNCQFTNAGLYAVLVTNAYGSVLSTNAILTVLAAPPCTGAPSNLLSWWRGEGNALDESGTNSGTLAGNTVYANAEVGRGFVFDGSGDAVQVGNALNLQLQDFTIESWIRRSDTGVVTYGTAGNGIIFGFGGNGYGLYLDQNGTPTLSKIGIDQTKPSIAITDLNFHHLAVTKSGATVVFYVDGIAFPAPDYNPGFTFSTGAAIGARSDNLDNSFLGTIDEVSVYSRGLSSAEIQGIYNASVSGKCPTIFPAVIITQPANQTVTVGANPAFSVVAGGNTPLSYQWRYNGTNISGATASSVTLNNVQMSQAGNYSVVATNVLGSATSSNALLTVNFAPATVRAVNTNCFGGSFVSVPIMLVANGNENAMAFSFNFDGTRLLYSSTAIGSSAAGADLMVNTTQTNSSQLARLGVEVIMPPGSTFSSGTQIVAMVTFFATNVASAGPSTITFSDAPTPRQLLDNQLNILSATYANGTINITLAPGYEGDVFPHTNGDRTITLADWLQIGRYVARLDFPANASEFQRADCAPRSTLGDGSIRATDWVQAGRYNSGLDWLTAMGGPTNEVAPPPLGPSTNRVLSIGSAALTPGTPTTIPITLAAQGNESALSFSVLFDTTRVGFLGAMAGTGASGATMFINTNQSASGLLGCAVALGAGNTFPAGNRELARVTFQALPTASGSFTPVFTDQPAWRDVSDVTALSLPIGYSAGIISINAPLKLRIAHSGTNVMLAWPLWASNFTVQQATNAVSGNSWTNLTVTPNVSNNENVVTLPISGTLKFYRLYHP
jgi:hypothetical protein